jgi:hypothetical protein
MRMGKRRKMRKFKNIIGLVLIMVMVFSLVGCSSGVTSDKVKEALYRTYPDDFGGEFGGEDFSIEVTDKKELGEDLYSIGFELVNDEGEVLYFTGIIDIGDKPKFKSLDY